MEKIPVVGERFVPDDEPLRRGISVDQSMFNMAESYAFDVVDWLSKCGALCVEAIAIDYQFKMSLVAESEEAGIPVAVDLSLTPDFMVFMQLEGRYVIACIDLKTGTHPVAVKSNAQLMTYLAYGTDLAQQVPGVADLSSISPQRIAAIWQGGVLAWWQPDREELDDWRDCSVSNAASEIATQNTRVVPTDRGCRQCDHRYNCAARMATAW